MIQFANPWALWFLLGVPLLIAFTWWVGRARRRALHQFGNPELIDKLTQTVSKRGRAVKSLLLIAAMSLLLLALARPQVGTKLEEIKRSGIDMVVAIDLSESMLAEDIKPNRLDKAKHELAAIIDKLEGDRIAIVAFAGEAFIQCPLTLDYGAAKMFLNNLDVNTISRPGTAITKAIETSVKAFDAKERKYKVLLLITDGEDHEGDPLEAAKKADDEGIKVFTVGIGRTSGEPIPERNASGVSLGYKKDRSGQVITTRLDEATLEKIALTTGGKYFHATPSESELDKIYNEIDKMEKKDLVAKKFASYEDRFQYPLALALILLFAELLISERKSIRAMKGVDLLGILLGKRTAPEEQSNG